MQIKLKKISIVNFKGIQHFETNFNHITSVFGDNATGKTTVFDAFLWLFFGKNSEDVSQFEVKRLDGKNNFIKDLESEVSAIIHVDGQEISVKKVLRQKWVKRRGELEANYNGDENLYFWNDVPFKEGEFKAKIKDIIDENLFKLITNPFYFNSLKWQDRRNILISIAGNISNAEIFDNIITASNKGQFNSLINALNANKTLDEFKRELAAKKKKVKDEAESIPSRIDEVRRGMPVALNFDEIRRQIEVLTEEMNAIQNTMNDELAMQQEENKSRTEILKKYNSDIQARQQAIFSIKTKLQNIEFDAKQQAKDASSKYKSELISVSRQIDEKKSEISRYATSLKNIQEAITSKQNELESLRKNYIDTDAEQMPEFNENEFVCPSCLQALPQDDIAAKKEELINNYNTNKIARIKAITDKASVIKAEIETLNTRLANGNGIVTGLEGEVNELCKRAEALQLQVDADSKSLEDLTKEILGANADYSLLLSDLEKTEASQIDEPKFSPLQTNDDLKNKRSAVYASISELQKELATEEQIKKSEARINELQTQESALAQQLADLEGTEFAIMQFTKAKIDALESRLNGKFKEVRFKLFNTQVNGGETECCETLIKGVPFSDANNAARINAGIDIINTLCQHYNVTAPIFIDNRESVTRLSDSESQIVNLIVSELDKKLRVA